MPPSGPAADPAVTGTAARRAARARRRCPSPGGQPAQAGRIGHVSVERRERDVADRHDPLPVALADDPDRLGLGVDRSVRSSPSASLTRRPDAYSSSSNARSRMPTALSASGLEQRRHLVHAQRLRQHARGAWQLQLVGDVRVDELLGDAEAVEGADRGRLARMLDGRSARADGPATAR